VYKFHDPTIAKIAEAAKATSATMQTQMGSGSNQSAAQAALSAINNFLSVAPSKYLAILGTVASGSAGGSTANVNWQQTIPIIPAFCTALDYNMTLPVTLTLAATSPAASIQLSPFAPYSTLANQLTLGGAPPWPLTELTPWYLDDIVHHINYDPDYPGLGNNSGIFGSIIDQGPTPNNIGGTGSLNPGTVVTNPSTTVVETTNYTWTFKVRQQLQRKRQLLWGAIPFGDPENRPDNLTQILPLIGTHPEQNLFVNSSSGSNTAVLNGATTVKATYELAYIDLLPPSMTSTPNPTVGYGLQLVQFSTNNLPAGTVQPITHRTAMIYTSIHQILVNGQVPVQADYYGLWDDQDVQSARWAYDAQVNTFNEYFDKFKRIYRRYPSVGHYVCDFENGVFPEIPSVTPLDALMSPDASYAAAFGVPVTPAMTTAIRLPSTDTPSNPYVRNYSFGLVRVPF